MTQYQNDHTAVTMPCGTRIDLTRPRSMGVLSADEQRYLQSVGARLAFDPLQAGWVPALVQDDLSIPDPNAPDTALEFRPWCDSDVDHFAHLLDDPAIWEHMPEPYPGPMTKDLAADLISVSNQSPHHKVRAVTHAGKIVGQVRLHFSKSNDAEISYWLGRSYWGKGLGSAKVRKFARESLAAHPKLSGIVARVKAGNIASMRVLEKAGFRRQGVDQNAPGWHILRLARRSPGQGAVHQ